MKIILWVLFLFCSSFSQVQATVFSAPQNGTTLKPKAKKDYILIFKKPIKKALIGNFLLTLMGLALLRLCILYVLPSFYILFLFGIGLAAILIVSGVLEIFLDYVLPRFIKN